MAKPNRQKYLIWIHTTSMAEWNFNERSRADPVDENGKFSILNIAITKPIKICIENDRSLLPKIIEIKQRSTAEC